MSLNFSPGACVINPLTNRPIRINKRAYKDLVRDYKRFEKSPERLKKTLSKREVKTYSPRSKASLERQKRFWRFVERKHGVPMRLPGQDKATPIPLKITDQVEIPQAFVLPIPRGQPRASLRSSSPEARLSSAPSRRASGAASPPSRRASAASRAASGAAASPARSNSIYDRFAKVFSGYSKKNVEISELTSRDVPDVRKLCNRDGCFKLTEDELEAYLRASKWHIKVTSFGRLVGILIGSPNWKPKFSRGYDSLVLQKSGTESQKTLNKDLRRYADLTLLCAESGSGIGRALLLSFQTLAKQEGAHSIAIDVGGTCDEELLNKFYKRAYPNLVEYDTYEIGKGKPQKPYVGIYPGSDPTMINLYTARFK